ncbi:ATP-binding cassette domain-containing protein [Falsiroseomonas sp. HW251]|uniref:ATP-binding cassette domain-containing protein n=1 Tax=Falsiroseomonas sp. HW251 TaxID=3390998 RepID=UPI003D315559
MSVLRLEGARPLDDDVSPLEAPMTLALEPGDLCLVRAADQGMARALTELCAGIPPLAEGRVVLLGEDMTTLPRRRAEPLRARIGIAPGEDGWLPHLPVEDSLLLARRHHGETDGAALRAEAEALCRHFGLDGIPAVSPHELSRLDLARVGCARAFLGKPDLLLLESPLDAEAADTLVEPLRRRLDGVLGRGAAALWTTRSHRAWEDPSFGATQRFELHRRGLVPA